MIMIKWFNGGFSSIYDYAYKAMLWKKYDVRPFLDTLKETSLK